MISILFNSREQMNREIKARREYAKKYFFMSKPEINQFYDQSFLSAKVNEAVPESKFVNSYNGFQLNDASINLQISLMHQAVSVIHTLYRKLCLIL